MKYILEFFSFGKKKDETPGDWESKANKIIDLFSKKVDDKSFDGTKIDEKGFTLSYFKLSKKIEKYTLFFYDRGDGYNVIDMDNVKNRIEISKEDYDKYYKVANNISDWVDDESDKNFNLSRTSFDDIGNFDTTEFAMDELNYEFEEKKIYQKIF